MEHPASGVGGGIGISTTTATAQNVNLPAAGAPAPTVATGSFSRTFLFTHLAIGFRKYMVFRPEEFRVTPCLTTRFFRRLTMHSCVLGRKSRCQSSKREAGAFSDERGRSHDLNPLLTPNIYIVD
jgi:hypothetical protein